MNIPAEVQQLIQAQTRGKPHVVLTLGVCSQGREQYASYGEDGVKQPVCGKLYEIGSITKLFTAGLLCQALAEGRIQLGDTIDAYLPGFAEHRHKPTILQLATHHGGYGDIADRGIDETKIYTENPFAAIDLPALQNRIAAQTEPPAAGWAYSNAGYGLLGHILGALQGTTYAGAMQGFIQDTLGLRGVTCVPRPAECLHGYRGELDCGSWRWPADCAIAGAGCLYANVQGLLAFLKLHLQDALPCLAASRRVYAPIDENFDMGLGWNIAKAGGIHFHAGGTGRFNTFAALHEASETAVAVLTNDYTGLEDAGAVAGTLLEALLE